MRRSILVAVVLVVVAIALAQPAAAKCGPVGPGCRKIKSVRAVIRGPGLGKPVVVRGGAFWDLARRTGISGYRSTYVESAIKDEFPGEQALGPRYEVRYMLRIKGADPLVVMQDLYPYAVNAGATGLPAAWAFTPKGQRFVTYYGDGVSRDRYPVEGGWWRSAALFETLVTEGLPKTPPVGIETAAEEAPAEAAVLKELAGSRPGGLSAFWGWFILLAMAAMLGIVTVIGWGRPHSKSV